MNRQSRYPGGKEPSDLLAAIAHELGLPAAPNPNQTLAQLGIDSLGLFQLVCLVDEWAGSPLGEGSADYPLLESVADVLAFYEELHQEAADGAPTSQV